MITFTSKINGKKVKFPTNIKEITPDYLDLMTKDITVGDDFVLIALCTKVKARKVAIYGVRSNPEKLEANVIPIFVKAGHSNSEFVNSLKTADAIFITKSEIEYGQYVNNAKENLSINNVVELLYNEYNKGLEDLTDDVITVSYRLVAANNIHAKRDLTVTSDINSEFGY